MGSRRPDAAPALKRLPVTDEGGRLLGIISREDLIRAMARSDESILADIEHALEILGEHSRGVEVGVRSGAVTLTGTAPDPGTIRLAAELASRVAGAHDVENLIEEASVGLDVTDADLSALDPFAVHQPRE